LLAGCGNSDDDGGGTCGKVSACGGDIVGNWAIQDFCVDDSLFAGVDDSSCPESTQSVSFEASGSAAFNADLTYAVSLVQSFSVKYGFPRSCLTSGGVTLTCEQLEDGIQNQISMPDSPFAGATCGSTSGGCSCTFDTPPVTTSESGTYTTSGSTVSTMPMGGSADSGEYCVDGGTLHLIARDPQNGATTADIVAIKQ